MTMPKQMKERLSKEEVRDIFESVDIDGSGGITPNEIFLWSLNIATIHTGAGLAGVFKKYDTTGDGHLDSAEFKRAVEDMGFGQYAHDIFMQLDDDESGQVSYGEIAEMLRNTKGSVSKECKKFLTTLAMHNKTGSDWSLLKIPSERIQGVSPLEWDISGDTLEELRIQLSDRLLENMMRVSDFYALITRSLGSDGKLTQDNFVSAMRQLGYKGESDDLLIKIFFLLDRDLSGEVSIDELYNWISGMTERWNKARDCTLLSNRNDGTTLYSIDWDPEEVRLQLQLMLMCNSISPVELLSAFDTTGSQGTDSKFEFKEFLRMLKKLVNPGTEHLPLWDSTIRPVVQETFRNISGTDRVIDAIELERWLNKGWKENLEQLQRRQRIRRENLEVESIDHAADADLNSLLATRMGAKSWISKKGTLGGTISPTRRKTPSPTPSRPKSPDGRSSKPAVPKAPPKPRPGLQRSKPVVLRKEEGWEVRDYLSKVCTLAQQQRPAYVLQNLNPRPLLQLADERVFESQFSQASAVGATRRRAA